MVSDMDERLARSDVLALALDFLQRNCSSGDIGAWIMQRELAVALGCNPGHLGRMLHKWWRAHDENEGPLRKANDHTGTCWSWEVR